MQAPDEAAPPAPSAGPGFKPWSEPLRASENKTPNGVFQHHTPTKHLGFDEAWGLKHSESSYTELKTELDQLDSENFSHRSFLVTVEASFPSFQREN